MRSGGIAERFESVSVSDWSPASVSFRNPRELFPRVSPSLFPLPVSLEARDTHIPGITQRLNSSRQSNIRRFGTLEDTLVQYAASWLLEV